MSDFLSERELNILKGEIEAKQYTLDAEKFMFARKLANGMGEKMMYQLNNPKPKQIKRGFFYKIRQWFRKRKEHRMYYKTLNFL